MTGPWLFFIGSPVKLTVWIGNRLATWTGLAVVWQKVKHAPNRSRRFFTWLVALNAVSLLALFGVWWLLKIH